jgi:hypothetical protein
MKRYLHVTGEGATPNSNRIPDGTAGGLPRVLFHILRINLVATERNARIYACGQGTREHFPQSQPVELGSYVHYRTNIPNLVLTYNDNDSDAKK